MSTLAIQTSVGRIEGTVSKTFDVDYPFGATAFGITGSCQRTAAEIQEFWAAVSQVLTANNLTQDDFRYVVPASTPPEHTVNVLSL